MAQSFDYPPKNKNLLVDEKEIWALSYYRASELSGALLMGRWARRAKDDELRARMTWHCAEEARHAWRWTELIRQLGANPLYIPDSYQSNYFSDVGIPKDDIEFLMITHVFEKRVAQHFTDHKKRKGTHPLVKKLLTTMIEDEGPHLRWVRKHLDQLIKQGHGKKIEKQLKLYEKVDYEAYRKQVEIFAEHDWTI